MVIAMFCFVINDTCVKIVGASLPVGEIVLIRGEFTAVLIAGLCARWRVLPALPQVASQPVILRAPRCAPPKATNFWPMPSTKP